MLLTYDELFLETLKDLRRKINSDSKYNLAHAAGLCRHLLIDSTPLLSIVNKERRLPVKFNVSSLSLLGLEKTNLEMVWTSIVPTERFGKTIDVGAHEFLAIPFLKIKPHIYTIKEMIRAASHCMGGMHSFKPENEKEEALFRLGSTIADGHKTTCFAMKAVCTVILKAMIPLEIIIIKEHTPAEGRYS